MGKVVLMLSISLDGYFEGPNREIDWHLVDDEVHTYINETMRDVGASLVLWHRYSDIPCSGQTAQLCHRIQTITAHFGGAAES